MTGHVAWHLSLRALLIYGVIKSIRMYRKIIHFTYVVHLLQFLRVFCGR